MKVLFAVSNDNITTSVVNKYQEKYKEIITSKNVYYFNAIIKELQRDKGYDAIIIGEDLEPIANNNYEAIDKFLIDKLDNISDEASKTTGEDIPIIFICSDRRTKSDQLLRKLFSMSIYNALVGNDRSLNMVCALINKPRNKKEAKKYYQIDSDQVDYEPQKEEIVSETQIQSILTYYKKIGNNEKKCVQAFDRIAKQYDDTQLRIIVKFLPMDVKAILEANSGKYQALMANGTVLSNGNYSKYDRTPPTRPKNIDFIQKDLEKTKMSKPVVIPETMKLSNVSQPTQIQPYTQPQSSNSTGNIQQNNLYNNVQQVNNPYQNNYSNNPYNNQYNNSYNNQQFNNPYSGVQQQNNDYYGNQQTNANPYGNVYAGTQLNSTNNNYYQEEHKMPGLDNIDLLGENEEQKVTEELPQKENKVVQPVPVEPVKRRRGRPRKNQPETDETTVSSIEPGVEPIKRRRGRPRKVVSNEETNQEVNTTSLNEYDSDLEQQNLNVPQQDLEFKEIESSDTNVQQIDEQPVAMSQQNDEEPINLFDLDIEQTNAPSNNFNSSVASTQRDIYSGYDNSQVYGNNSVYGNSNSEYNSQYDDVYSNVNGFNTNNTLVQTEQNDNRSQLNNFMQQTNVTVGNGKIVSFVGTTKNGTSFVVNNLAEILSRSNIKTAIVDLTRNKNAYYMFTNNDSRLMQIATNSMQNLANGIIEGVKVNPNLDVFTSLPDEIKEQRLNDSAIIQNVSNNYDVVLLDCDFETNQLYFSYSNEIYLVQTMDAFTIQPLTKFLSDLKLKNLLDENKLRIIINKHVKLRRLDYKMIIGGMSKYNEPSMTLQRDLFNPAVIQSITIPFEEQTYEKYLESIAMCQISLNGYSQNFMQSLEQLKNMVYPLVAGSNMNNSNKYGNYEKNSKKGLFGNKKNNDAQFSNNVNDTLNKMRTNNY